MKIPLPLKVSHSRIHKCRTPRQGFFTRFRILFQNKRISFVFSHHMSTRSLIHRYPCHRLFCIIMGHLLHRRPAGNSGCLFRGASCSGCRAHPVPYPPPGPQPGFYYSDRRYGRQARAAKPPSRDRPLASGRIPVGGSLGSFHLLWSCLSFSCLVTWYP